MGSFLDGHKVGNKTTFEDGLKFYKILEVGCGVLENASYNIRDIFGKGRVLILSGNKFSKELAGIVRSIVGDGNRNIRCVVSVGGGSVIDRGKFLAFKMKVPFISIPTMISSDGIASPVAVKGHRSEFVGLPYGIIVDIEIVRNAPVWSIMAGTGDLISNLSASVDWDRFKDKSEEPYNATASLISRFSALSILDTDPFRSITILTWGLILSGWAMCMAGSSRPASGPEHKISHALDVMKFGEKHGIQVGFFTPLFLEINGYPGWERVRRYLTGIGFPDKVKMKREFAEKVFSIASGTRPHRWTVIEEVGWEKVLERAVKLGFVEIA